MRSPRDQFGRALSWGLTVVTLAFVAWVVPVRDRCWDARAPQSTRVAVTYGQQAQGCLLHLKSGEVAIDAAACARLKCEPGLVSTFQHVDLGVLGALFVIYGLGTLAWAARWRALLRFADVDLPLGRVWRISIEAQAGGILLPGGIGGDALRIASVATWMAPRREGGTRSSILGVVASILLDRAVGLAVLSAVAAALGFAWGGLKAGPLAAALAAIPVVFVVGFILVRAAPPLRVRWLARGRIGQVAGPLLDYVRDPRAPRAVALAAALSVLVSGTQFATIRGLVVALGAHPTSEKWVYVGSAMALIVGVVPALPGGWGTTDAAFVFFLGLAGLPAGTAMAVSLLYRLFWYVLGLAGAVLYMLRRRPAQAMSAETARVEASREPDPLNGPTLLG